MVCPMSVLQSKIFKDENLASCFENVSALPSGVLADALLFRMFASLAISSMLCRSETACLKMERRILCKVTFRKFLALRICLRVGVLLNGVALVRGITVVSSR